MLDLEGLEVPIISQDFLQQFQGLGYRMPVFIWTLFAFSHGRCGKIHAQRFFVACGLFTILRILIRTEIPPSTRNCRYCAGFLTN